MTFPGLFFPSELEFPTRTVFLHELYQENKGSSHISKLSLLLKISRPGMVSHLLLKSAQKGSQESSYSSVKLWRFLENRDFRSFSELAAADLETDRCYIFSEFQENI